MSSDPQVHISSEGKSKAMQWAKGAFYRKEGGKLTIEKKSLKVLVAGLSILTSLMLLFATPPLERNASVNHSVSVPELRNNDSQDSSNLVEVEANQIEARIEEERRQRREGRTASRKKRKIVVSKLGVVSRDEVSRVPPGSMLKAKLMTGGANGMVKAKVLEDFYVNGEIVIEEGSTFLGVGHSGEERLYLNFTTIIDPSLKSSRVKAQAYDHRDKTLGLKGEKIGRAITKVAAVTGLNFVGGMTQALQQTEVRDGLPITKSTMKNALLNGASTATLAQASEMMEDLKEKQTIIEVKEGSLFYLVFEEIREEH